ncbi:MAG TPA: iron-containing alcohol dehydrogenase [Tepidisphaeraceae bacterium]|jgi:alcohol dehydrogenase class IV|nr:iron-containing alcohol dehydrogenase [Tepidisphaeraceae bacterium]
MMSFEFNTPSRILFGRGQVKRLAELGPPFGAAALMVHGGNEERWQVQVVRKILEEKQIQLTLVRQQGEPHVEQVDQIVAKARRCDCEFIIGIGGGSAIDAAKAVAGLLSNGGSALDYLEVVGKGRKFSRPSLPWIAIPTTAGTGAEATRNAVLTSGTFKASMRSEHLFPRLAIVDSELGLGIPQTIYASSGMDALCQLIESYTSTGANPMTDGLALRGIELAAPALVRAYGWPSDDDARDAMALAALLSGICLTNAGLGAVHGFAAPLGGHFPIPHGVICAALLPPVISANVAALRGERPEHPTLFRYATIGRLAAGQSDLSRDEAIAHLERFCLDLLCQLSIPNFAEFMLNESHIEKMIPLARQSSSMKYNPVKLSDEALAGILRAGIAGYPDPK